MLSVVTLAATIPLLATSTIQLQEQSQKTKEDQDNELKTEKCHLRARASPRMSAQRREQMKDMEVVLQNGYFLPYPERGYDGLVTTINDDNFLNWVYVQKDTYQVKYGVRADAQPNLTGPTTLASASNDTEWHVAFEGWEGFVAVEEYKGFWSVCFDRDDNGLKDRSKGKPVVEIELIRVPLGTNTQTETSVPNKTTVSGESSIRKEPNKPTNTSGTMDADASSSDGTEF